jgi:hypothetical protein
VATPGVITIALPPSHNSTELGRQLQKAGYLLSYNSDYLRQRNWIQICLMGEFSPEKLESLTTWLVKNALPTPATPPVRAAVASLLLGGILLTFCLDRPPALPAVTILPPGPLVAKSGRVPDRWIPAKWTWLQKTCLFVFGPPRQVGFSTEFIEASESVPSIVAHNSLGPPQAESNGLAVWILPGDVLVQPGGASSIMSAPRILTVDAGLSVVISSAFRAELFPQMNNGTVDLSTRLIVSSAMQTNFVAAVRAQLPYGKALFLLDVRHPESASNRQEFLITADEYDAKGNKLNPPTPPR